MSDIQLLSLVAYCFIGYLWWFFTFEYRKYQVELLRQKLFVTRDELFELAIKGDIPINSDAYKMARSTLNGMIRFAEDFDILMLAIPKIFKSLRPNKRMVDRYVDDFHRALLAIPEPSRAIILRAYVRAHLLLVSHLLNTSIVLFPIVIVLKFLEMYWRTRKQTTQLLVVYKEFVQWKRFEAVGNHLDAIAYNRSKGGKPNDRSPLPA